VAENDDKLAGYYDQGVELERLRSRTGLIEAARTQALVLRHLPGGATVLDVGGATGFYADWLARRGHRVQLVDVVPFHVDAARKTAGAPPTFEAEVGDARALRFDDASFDAVLMLGPLYHLVERNERVSALREAGRVCRPGGVIFAAAISRFAPALDGVREGWIAGELQFETVKLQLTEGTSGDHQPGFPAISYFHHADELVEEARQAGLGIEGVFGVEGPGWLLQDLEEKWADAVMRERLLWLAELMERDPRTLSISAHLLLVAHPSTTA
jgi:ubiquinone/menaquinone biosynthesis C-methylase UbiE